MSEKKSEKYKILPVKVERKKHEKWADVDEMLPIHPFAVLCQAPPKSGKTNWCLNMVLNENFSWINRFDRIVWISPTIMSDKTAKPLFKVIDPEIEDNPYSDKVKIFTDSDIDNIDAIIQSILEDQRENPEITTLIILDDCIGKMKNGEFGRLYAKYRHNNLSLLGISQTFKSFDVISRASANGYVLFKTYNQREKQKIMDELSGFPNIEQMYDQVVDKKHSFLWINIENQAVYDNFDKLLWKKN